MEKIYGYSRRHEQKTRHSLENLAEVLQGFLEEYTDATLKKIVLDYWPMRPGECAYPKELLETDDEIDRTLEYIEKMNILSKERHFDYRYRRYRYELPITHYGDVLKFVKDRGGKYSGVYMFLHQYFNFKHYDYSKVLEFINNHEYCQMGNMSLCISKQNEVNELAVHISNDFYNKKKCSHRIGFTLLFPELLEQDRLFLQKIEQKLEIRFLPRNFFYYYIHRFKNGERKIKYKWEKRQI